MQVELVADDALVDIVAAGLTLACVLASACNKIVVWRCPSARRSVLWWWPRRLIWLRMARPARRMNCRAMLCVRSALSSGAIYRWDFARDGEALEVEVNGPITVGEMLLAIHAAEAGLGLAYGYAKLRRRRAGCWAFAHRADDWRPADEHFICHLPQPHIIGLRACGART